MFIEGQENILGEPLPDETPADGEGDGEKEEDKGKDGDGKKEEEKPAETVETLTAKLAELSKAKDDLEKSGKDKDGNIRAMGDKIRQLEKAIKDGKGDEKKDGNVLFKEIKRVAQMSKEEREKLSDNEASLIDQIAELKEGMNQMFDKLSKGEEAKDAINPVQVVKDAAKELAGGNREMANQIIEAFNGLKFNLDGLSEEEIIKRVTTAAKEVPTYKPKKEQQTATGKPAKDTKANGTTVDTSKEREQAKKNVSGKYEL